MPNVQSAIQTAASRFASEVVQLLRGATLQELLAPYRDLIRELLGRVKTTSAVRVWLRSAREDLDGRTPLAAIREGEIETVRSAAARRDPAT